MAFIYHDITVLNLDQSYLPQSHLHKPSYEWIDLSDLDKTNLYCAKESFSIIKQRLKKRQKRGITFIGSGNYHYVSYLLLSEIEKPFTLILFDHHTDMIESPYSTFISCGSWVLQTIKRLTMLKKVIIVGVRDDLQELVPFGLNEKTTLFSTKQYHFGHEQELASSILSNIPTNIVYISIDKDVLDRSEAVTNWDQGNMKLLSLVHLIRYLAAHKHILGMDICGEYHLSAANPFDAESRQAIHLNEQANRMLINSMH